MVIESRLQDKSLAMPHQLCHAIEITKATEPQRNLEKKVAALATETTGAAPKMQMNTLTATPTITPVMRD